MQLPSLEIWKSLAGKMPLAPLSLGSALIRMGILGSIFPNTSCILALNISSLSGGSTTRLLPLFLTLLFWLTMALCMVNKSVTAFSLSVSSPRKEVKRRSIRAYPRPRLPCRSRGQFLPTLPPGQSPILNSLWLQSLTMKQ